MQIEIWLLILGMAIVTFIPRALPVIFIERMRFGKKAEKFLKLIPYTAMAALIFPGILTVDSSVPWVGIAGGCVAAGFAWKKMPVMVCVLAAIAGEFLIYTLLL
ncbi:MAG: AzlD domain-containing protein [Clostridiales bacterium]|nr:AzlD domain-containing protein [Clostridiales bacterium]